MKKFSLIILILPSLALAAEHGHPSIKDTYPYWINFIIFVSLLSFLLNKPLRRFWAGRRVALEESINRGKKAIEEAKIELHSAQARYQNASAEIDSIRTQISAEALQEAERVLSSAEEQAERIIGHAGKSAEAEKQAALKLVQEDFAEKVYEAARIKLQSDFSPEFDKDYRSKAFKGVTALKG